MTVPERPAEDARGGPRRGLFWAMVPVVLLGATVLGLASLAVVASSDPSFAVERDYYRRAAAWDEHTAELEASARLGWNIAIEIHPQPGGADLVATLLDRQGQPLPGAVVAVEAFHNARRNLAVEVRLHADGREGYRTFLPMRKSGLWEFRFRAERDGARFVRTLRGDVDLRAPMIRLPRGGA